MTFTLMVWVGLPAAVIYSSPEGQPEDPVSAEMALVRASSIMLDTGDSNKR